MTTLSDLGERRILREIIPNFVHGAGDDCATLQLQRKYAVVTTDPVPRPAAEVIAGDMDPYWLGWLLVTINASDIAASGARPDAFVAHLDLPSNYDLELFTRLLQGISDSCEANGLRYVGGNLREAKALTAVGTAIGSSDVLPLGRRGANAGDNLVLLGRSGQFWIDAFKVQQGSEVDKHTSPLFKPVSQSNIIWRLHEEGLLVGAMDTSDGLAPTLEELSLVNELTLQVHIPALRGPGELLVDQRLSRERLSFGWGDWTVAAIVAPANVEPLRKLAEAIGATATPVGRFILGQPSVELVDGSRAIRASRLESERFAPDSWFTEGIGAYMAMLAAFPLP